MGPTRRPLFKCVTQRDSTILQPITEKSLDPLDKVELSTEYRQLAGGDFQNSLADRSGPMLSEQEQEQHRLLQNSVTSSNLIAILNRQNEITSMLLKQQQMFTLPPKNVTIFDGDILQFRRPLNTTLR